MDDEEEGQDSEGQAGAEEEDEDHSTRRQRSPTPPPKVAKKRKVDPVPVKSEKSITSKTTPRNSTRRKSDEHSNMSTRSTPTKVHDQKYSEPKPSTSATKSKRIKKEQISELFEGPDDDEEDEEYSNDAEVNECTSYGDTDISAPIMASTPAKKMAASVVSLPKISVEVSSLTSTTILHNVTSVNQTEAVDAEVDPNAVDNGTQVGRHEERIGDHLQRLLEISVQNQTLITQELKESRLILAALTAKVMVQEKDTQTDLQPFFSFGMETSTTNKITQTDELMVHSVLLQTDEVIISNTTSQTDVMDLRTFGQQTTPAKISVQIPHLDLSPGNKDGIPNVNPASKPSSQPKGVDSVASSTVVNEEASKITEKAGSANNEDGVDSQPPATDEEKTKDKMVPSTSTEGKVEINFQPEVIPATNGQLVDDTVPDAEEVEENLEGGAAPAVEVIAEVPTEAPTEEQEEDVVPKRGRKLGLSGATNASQRPRRRAAKK